jgi:hypothetical protein
MNRMNRQKLGVLAVAASAVLLLASGGAAVAHEAHGHPARIHEGSCEVLGAVAFRLNGVGGSVDLDGTPIATPTAVNDEAHEVVLSETTIDASLDDLLGSDLALMVYESDEDMSAITCGNLGGAMLGETLVTALAESGVPGHVGFAVFAPDGEGTSVSVYLAHGLAGLTAAEGADDHAESEGEEHEHEEGDEHDDAEATPTA